MLTVAAIDLHLHHHPSSPSRSQPNTPTYSPLANTYKELTAGISIGNPLSENTTEKTPTSSPRLHESTPRSRKLRMAIFSYRRCIEEGQSVWRVDVWNGLIVKNQLQDNDVVSVGYDGTTKSDIDARFVEA
jgi:hypothetical protein